MQKEIKRYESIMIDKVTVNFIFDKGKFGNFTKSQDGKGYTLNFLATIEDCQNWNPEKDDLGLVTKDVFARTFVDNNEKDLDKFFETFKINAVFENVDCLKKTVIKEGEKPTVLYIMNLGYSIPNAGLNLQELRNKILKEKA